MRAGDEAVHRGFEADAAAEAHPELRLQRGERHRAAVPGEVRLVRGDASRERLVAATNGLARERRRHRGAGKTEDPVGHRDVEDGALACAITVAQRGEDRDHTPHAAADVGELRGRHLRRRAHRPLRAEDSGPSEVVEVVAGALRELARLAVSRERTNDEARVLAAEHGVAEAEAIEHAGAELLEEDVVGANDAQERGLGVGLLEVDHSAPLAAVEELERRGLTARVGRHVAQVVAAARVFDLVDGGAEIGEDERREGPGQEPGQVENTDVLEGTHARCVVRREAGRKLRKPSRSRTASRASSRASGCRRP